LHFANTFTLELVDAVPGTIYHAQKRFKQFGTVYAPTKEKFGRPREMDENVIQVSIF